eukprot:m.159718 g.159718  ORF g.159718 m.159718 type:complete len:96 (-) comp31151_c0_seq3:171-458(-)
MARNNNSMNTATRSNTGSFDFMVSMNAPCVATETGVLAVDVVAVVETCSSLVSEAADSNGMVSSSLLIVNRAYLDIVKRGLFAFKMMFYHAVPVV